MKKIIISISFCLMALNLLAQVSDGAQIVTTSQASQKIDVTINGKASNIQLQVGAIFQRGIIDENNSDKTYDAIFRFPWNIQYIYDTFSEENASFDISKGFFGDKILISWELKSNYDAIKLLKIYRREYTIDNSENWVFQSNVSKDENSFEDLYVDGGVLYEYRVEAEGLEGNEYLQKYITGIGFRSPTAIVTGNVSFDGGSGVKDVTVSATTNTNNESTGNSLLINGNSFLDIQRINKPIKTVATLQTWVKPFERRSYLSPISLFNLNDTNKHIYITVTVDQPRFGGLVFQVGSSQFVLRNFFPSGNANNRGDDIMLPIDSFFDVFTHFSVVLNDQNKPKLFINGREINASFIKQVQEIEITKNDKKIKPYQDISFSDFDNNIDLSTAHENFWNDIKIGGWDTAIFDEIRIWNSELSENEIRTDFKRYISGNDKRLISYIGINEGLGNYLYDNSRDGFNYNKNHAEFGTIRVDNKHEITWLDGVNNTPSTSKLSDDGSGSYQLGVLGVTDEFGNYEISAIPYTGNGESFKITPSYGLHKFEPNQKLVYLGKESSVVNEINFIDKSSFQFKGQVLYDSRGVFKPLKDEIESEFTEDGYNTYQDINGVPYIMGQYWKSEDSGNLKEYIAIGLEGANVYIDDEIQLNENNLPIETDDEGKFTLNVPIGNHSIKVKKYGHNFLYNGRYPEASEDEDKNYVEFFEDKEDFVTFIDTTRVTVVGRIVGGAVQAEKVIGFSGFLNNSEDEEDTTNNETYSDAEGVFRDENENEVDGVFTEKYLNAEGNEVDEIISSVNNIGQASITFNYPDHQNVIVETRFTFKTNKETGEYRVQVLPLDYKYKSSDIRILNDDDKLQIVSDDARILAFFEVPFKETVPEYESKNNVKIEGEGYHFAQSFNYRTTPDLNVISQTSEKVIKIGDNLFITDGFDYKIYEQGKDYTIELETFEKYTNYDTTESIEDIVPVIDGKLFPTNNLALAGTENYTLIPNSNRSTYTFKAGIPNFGSDAKFTKTISLKYRVNKVDYNPVGNFNPEGIVIGGAAGEERTFRTKAPDIPDIILRDPPGSNSFASIESGQSISLSTNYDLDKTEGISENLTLNLGSVFAIGGGLAGPSIKTEFTNSLDGNMSLAYSSNSSDGLTKTYTFNKTISTSDDPDWVGGDADLYIGNSLNYFNASFKKLGFSNEKIEDEFNLELKNTNDEIVYINQTKGYAMSPDPSKTFFVYSQRHILQEIIPDIEEIITAINTPNSETIAGEDGVLEIEEYEEQIRVWKLVILRNEIDKFIATNPNLLEKKKKLIQSIPQTLNNNLTDVLDNLVLGPTEDHLGFEDLQNKLNESKKIANLIDSHFKENISFDAGVGEITKSVETATVTSSSISFNLTVDESLALTLGGKVGGHGLVSTTTGFLQQDMSNSLSEEDTETTVFSYTLKDNDPNNFISVDIINFFGKYGPIFSSQGGQTSCPYEGSELSKFLTKAQFEEYFKNYDIELEILEKESKKQLLEYKYTFAGSGGGRISDKNEAVKIGDEIEVLRIIREQDFQNLMNYLDLDNTEKAKLSFATQQIEAPLILVKINDVTNIPESENAEFKLSLSNNGITGETLKFRLRVANETNPNQAITNIEPNGTIVSVPAEGTTFIMTLAKSVSDVYDYKNIKVILESLCDDDISSSVEVSASFVPTCSNVVVSSPVNNWLYNKDLSTNVDNSTKPLKIKLNGFNSSLSSFNKIELKYKSSISPVPTILHTFYKNEVDYNSDTKNGTEKTSLYSLIGDKSELTYPFFIKDRNLITDGDYEIYAVSYCTNKTETSSEIITGRVDLNAPQNFGTPLPIDGTLSAGEDLRVRFNQNIFYKLASKIEILGVTNQLPIDNSISLYFNGENNSATIEKPRIVSGDFSLEFWMKNETIVSSANIFSQKEGVNISLINGQINAKLGANTAKGIIKNDNLFHHYSVTFENTSGKLHIYEDDKEIALTNGNADTPFTNSHDLIIGGSNFIGNIHDLRIWSKFLSRKDAYANIYTKYIGNESGLLGYWPMNEGRGDLANDLAFFKHAQVNTNWDIKPKGNSYEFKNTQYLELDKLSNVILSGNMDATISFWIKTGASQEATIFSNGRGDNKWAININSNGLLTFESEGNSYPMSTESIVDDQWHHIAVVLNRLGSMNTYIDAAQASSNPVEEINGFSGTKAWLGARGHVDVESIDRNFTGKIDEFRFWNSARTIDQISRDRFNEVDIQSIGLMLYLRFNEPESSTGNGPRYWHTSTGIDNIPLNSIPKNGATINYNNDVPSIKPARPLIKFDVNHVINGDEMIIEPNISDWAVLEGQVLDITVHRMFDSANNRQESPITWTAYVQKNQVDWFVEDHLDVVELVKYTDEEHPFEITLVNNGGTTEQFSILNVPSWLHLDVSSGVISPKSKRIITATIDKELSAHIYNEILYLETDFGHNQKLPVSLRVLEQEPDWAVNPNDFNSSSNIIGRIKVEGLFSDDKYDRVGVFFNDEVRGVSNLEYDESYNQYYTYLTIYSNVGNADDSESNETENLNFKIWDASEGKVLESTIDGVLSIVYKLNDVRGNLINPALFENTESIEQEIDFNNGWTWVSFNVSDEGFNNINKLTNNMSLSTNDRIISTAPVKTETYTEGFGWDGSISANGGLSGSNMYKVYLSNQQSLKIKGPLVDINNWEFKIVNDWNWLPFTLPSNLLLNNALANYSASAGDVIKSQNLFAIYDDNNGWIGSLNYLEEGKGYMLESSLEQTFKYPNLYAKFSSKSSQQENISSDFSKYSSNMNAIVIIPEEYNELLVFDANNTLKGVSKTKTYGNKELNFITVYGDENEDLVFYLKKDKKLKATTKKFNFSKNTLLGSYNKPIDLRDTKYVFSVSPNPFKKQFIININSQKEQVSRILLFSTTGQMVYKKDFNLSEGNNSLLIKPEISNGVYLLHYISNNETVIKKIIKN
jgi:hypothetical protein